jgi:hypothetical protein
MRQITVESPKEFMERHSATGPSAKASNRRWVFADGAQLIDRGYPLDPEGHEPPEDEIALAKLRREYLQLRLKVEVDAFNTFRSKCYEQLLYAKRWPSYGGAPGPDDIEQLKAGKKRIEALRNQLQEVEERLSQTPEAARQREREQDAAEEAEHLADIGNQIAAIQI